MSDIRVLALSGGHVYSHVGALLTRDGARVRADVAERSDEAVRAPTGALGRPPPASRDRMPLNRASMVRIYPHQQLLILHGHVHYFERDQIIGDKYVVTVHGALNSA
jgi:hypothetical protein